MEHVCDTCIYCVAIVCPPSPGSNTDGVDCKNEALAKDQGAEATEEFALNGWVNYWRIEALDPKDMCVFWEPKCPSCGKLLSFYTSRNASISYNKEDGIWELHPSPEAEYRCSDCHVLLDTSDIRDILNDL